MRSRHWGAVMLDETGRCHSGLNVALLTLGLMLAGRQLLQSSAPPPGGCVCPLVFAPVCAADPATKMNITFENACQVALSTTIWFETTIPELAASAEPDTDMQSL